MKSAPEDIVSFWREAGPKSWFTKSASFDESIRASFGDDVAAARDGALDEWSHDPASALALILLLDQFPRNIFRDTPEMFASDAKALAVAGAAINAGHDTMLDPGMRAFIYMPFMHSELLADQDRSVALFESLAAEANIKHAREHREIIVRFSRFPHRNAILGRPSTPAEDAYLKGGGFKG